MMIAIELDMWEFNDGALAFYESAGLKTYRRYMESYTDTEYTFIISKVKYRMVLRSINFRVHLPKTQV